MGRYLVSQLRSVSPWDGSMVYDGAAEDAVTWGEVPALAEVHARLRTLGAVLTARRDEAVALLIREAGKVRADAEAEADLLPRKIDITLDTGLARTPLQVDATVTGPVRWRPRGPALILGPFNFPLHLLHGLVVPALAMGCPVVAKPSERCPALGAWYRDRLIEAGLGAAARVVLAGPEVVPALLADPSLATVAAVGSRRMGLALTAALAARPEVVVALELGGVNPALLLDDADLAAAAPVLADGAWRMAGQRCTATRQVWVPRAQRRAVRVAS
jgi:succinylglutamic semialdehyde dehydrogenase